MADIHEAARQLGEAFSEVEADLERTVYDSLAPHIKILGEGVRGVEESLKRMSNISKLVQILLNNPRIGVNEASLAELETVLAPTSLYSGRFTMGLTIKQPDIQADLHEDGEDDDEDEPEPVREVNPDRRVRPATAGIAAELGIPPTHFGDDGRLRVTQTVYSALLVHYPQATLNRFTRASGDLFRENDIHRAMRWVEAQLLEERGGVLRDLANNWNAIRIEGI